MISYRNTFRCNTTIRSLILTIVLNFAKSFHLEKQCLIVEEEHSINAVYCDALVLKDAKEICNRLLFEELEKIKNYCMRIEGERVKNKVDFWAHLYKGS